MYSQKDIEWFQRKGQAPPAHHEHTTDSFDQPISKKLKRLQTSNWRLEGNKLIADTEHGELVQYIPTDMICTGTDNDGLPILKKVVLE